EVTLSEAPDNAATDQTCWSLADPDSEAYHCANWALDHLRRHPHHNIVVVVPDLREAQQRLLYHFLATFHPEADRPDTATVSPLFNLSLGSPLSDYPLIHDALALLATQWLDNSLEAMVVWLRSPFIRGGEQERLQRGQLETDLWQQGHLWLSLTQLYDSTEHCPLLAQQLQSMQRWLEACAASQSPPSTWARRYTDLMRQLGWPQGDRTLTSHEYQQWQQWCLLLTQLSSLDVIQPSVTGQQALALLQRMAGDTLFQPETADDVPVHIMGVMETAGLHFDAAWLMGMSADCWPPAPQLNPFLPIALQRQMTMIPATRQQSLQQADRATRRLLALAGEVIISYPQQRQERLLWLSPLIEQLATLSSPPQSPQHPAVWQQPPDGFIESRPHPDPSVPWQSPPTVLRGGAAVLQSQSLCPFQAFARYRLGARPMIRPTLPYGMAERGQLLHLAMARLWRELQSSQPLQQAVATDRLSTEIEQAVREALQHPSIQRALDRLPQSLITVEHKRVQRLLQAWLEREARRQEPFTVIATEQERTATIAGMTATIRIDRVDQLADGRLAIIDYKSGRAASSNLWYGDRPRDPQLPLYAITLDPDAGQVSALLLARIEAKKPELTGWCVIPHRLGDSTVATVADKTMAEWQQHWSEWHVILERLGQAFRDGDAHINPLDDKVCHLCHLLPLCRHQQSGEEKDDEQTGSNEEDPV
ncbi:MAG: PD-(D/E)XK nuclease family protein, partial [Magnetococcales bacterium]|nr:PD-(D/E)XK nuclease family protein [Magnetococcales bacterium]